MGLVSSLSDNVRVLVYPKNQANGPEVSDSESNTGAVIQIVSRYSITFLFISKKEGKIFKVCKHAQSNTISVTMFALPL
jgi:hypothetical protein